MDIPRPAVPSDHLAGWRETDASVEEAFSTPVVTVYTHTVVFEETEARERIRAQTGCDHPWQFFFVSRIRLAPPRDPGPVLTKLVRRKAAAGFTDRLADRGIEQITERGRRDRSIGDTDGLLVTYGGLVRRSIQDRDPTDSSTVADERTDASSPTDDTAPALLSVPITAVLGVWAADGDYHVAGGGTPAGPPDRGPSDVVDAVAETVDPTAARETLLALIDACGQVG